MGKVIERKEKDFLIIKIYVDGIIFGASDEHLCEENLPIW